jgi:hypothetical protein
MKSHSRRIVVSIPFPSAVFFQALQEAMEREPGCTEALDPCEAYCGFAIDQQLYVLEFDGRQCAAVVAGGNELDLDFVVAGPGSAWQQIVAAVEEPKADVAATLPGLVEQGALEIRSADDSGPELARAALPFLQVFLEPARGLELDFG